MDEEKKRRLYELASKEAYEQETRQQNTTANTNDSQPEPEDNQYYETGQKIGKWLHTWQGMILPVISALIIIVIFTGVMVTIVSNTSDSSDSGSSKKTTESNFIVSVSQSIIYQSDDVIVSTTGDFKETSSQIVIDLIFENLKDTDSTYVYYGGGINDLTLTDDTLSIDDVEILANKKATAKLKIDKSALKKDGFSVICGINISLQPYHMLLRSTSSTIIFGRIDVNDEKIEYYDYPELYNEDGIVVEQMDMTGNTANFVVINRTEYPFEFSLHDVSVNDITYDTEEWLDAKNGYVYSSDVVLPDCRYEFSIPIKTGFKSDSHIDTIENIEYEIHISAGQLLTGGTFENIDVSAVYGE